MSRVLKVQFGRVIAITSIGLAQAIAFAQAPPLAEPQESKAIRRVVTKLDESGKSVVMFDDQLMLTRPRPPNYNLDLWATQTGPADFSWTDDRAKLIKGFSPPKGGTSFRVVEFPPVTPGIDKLDLNTIMSMVGADVPAKGRPSKHPLMHRTRTVDYAIILSGEISMMLDESEVLLKTGDMVVQQATNHAWINRGNVPCRIAFVMMDSVEP
jgi:mannose-6-phosphate isomerase-like protein (cupin superfamily)